MKEIIIRERVDGEWTYLTHRLNDNAQVFTGMKDKNGKPIFEGDLLRAGFDEDDEDSADTGQVVWNDEIAAWMIQKKPTPYLDFIHVNDCKNYWQIVGNVLDEEDGDE